MDIMLKDKNGVVLKTEKKYCKEDITVRVDTEELNVIPNAETQVKEGLFNKVTVVGENNLVSENIKKDVSIFGVIGSYEGVKQFATIEEMNNTIGKEGDLAIVYNKNSLTDLEAGQTYTSLYLPRTIVFKKAITSLQSIVLNAGAAATTSSVRITTSAIQFYKPGGFLGTAVSTVLYSSTDGITYTRTDNLDEELTITEIYEGVYTEITVQEGNLDLLQQMFKTRNNIFVGLFVNSGEEWVLAPTQLTATKENVFKANFYGKNGVEKGTLQNNTNLTIEEIKSKLKVYEYLCNLTTSETDLQNVFAHYNGVQVPLLDTSNATNLRQAFYSCSKLIRLPDMDTKNVTNMYAMCQNCSNLVHVPVLDTSKVTTMWEGFKSCTSLSSESLNNILLMCKNATAYTSTKTLKQIGLTSEQANACKTLSNYSAFTSAGWTTGY